MVSSRSLQPVESLDLLSCPGGSIPGMIHLTQEPEPSREAELIRTEATFFGIFDGHAGTGAALMAANCLHEHVRERLSQVLTDRHS